MQLSLLGICCSPGNGNDPVAELSIVQLAGYSVSADGITTCTVASTPTGRIFLGGADGHLYEIVYSSNDGWMTKRMSKVRWAAALRPQALQSPIIASGTMLWQLESEAFNPKGSDQTCLNAVAIHINCCLCH